MHIQRNDAQVVSAFIRRQICSVNVDNVFMNGNSSQPTPSFLFP